MTGKIVVHGPKNKFLKIVTEILADFHYSIGFIHYCKSSLKVIGGINVINQASMIKFRNFSSQETFLRFMVR